MLSILCNDLKLEYIKILLKRNDVELSDVNLNDINMLFATYVVSIVITITSYMAAQKQYEYFIVLITALYHNFNEE